MIRLLAIFVLTWPAFCETGVVFDWARWVGGSASVAFGTMDRAGDIYLAGNTTANDFPATGSFTVGNGGRSVVFVKVDRASGKLRYSFLLRGVTIDVLRGLAAGPRGELHALINDEGPKAGPQFAESSNHFVLTLSPEGDRIERSSGLGICSSPNSPIGVDPDGNVVIAMVCPTNAVPVEQHYLLRIGRETISKTPLPDFQAWGLTVDTAGNAIVTGSTWENRAYTETQASLPADRVESKRPDVAVVKVGPGGKLIAAVRFGGSGEDRGISVDVDEAGDVYIFGTSKVPLDKLNHPVSFPVTEDSADRNERDGLFAAKLDSSLNQLLWSTYVRSQKDKDKLPRFAWLTGRGEFAVATTKFLSTVSTDGRTVSDQTRIAPGHAYIAGRGGRAMVYAVTRYPQTSRAEPLIATGEQWSWFAAVDLYRDGAPELELSVGELEYLPLALPHDGTTYASGMPVAVRAGDGEFEYVHGELAGAELQVPTDSPSELQSGPSTPTIRSARTIPRSYFFLAAGVRNGLQVLDYTSGVRQPSVRVDRNVAIIPPTSSQPVTVDATLRIWDFTPYWGLSEISDRYEVTTVFDPWLTVSPLSGQAPANIEFRVDPTRLPDGSNGITQVVFIPGVPQNSRVTFSVIRPPATPAPAAAQFSVTPQIPELILSGPRTAQSRTIRIASTGEEIDFTLAAGPFLSLSTNRGRTPAEVTVSATQTPQFSSFPTQITIQGPRQGLTIQVRLASFSGELLGGTRFRDTFARYLRSDLFVPVYMLPVEPPLGSYQFRCGEHSWHILGAEDASSESGDAKWTLLTPNDAPLGPCRFEMRTPEGELLAARDIVIRETAPASSGRARFADGTLVSPAAGVRPGDWVNIPAGGLGIAAGADGEPVHLADAFVYLGERRLLSVTRMSREAAGTYEVWVQIPPLLTYGDHFLRVSYNGIDSQTRVPVRVLRPAE